MEAADWGAASGRPSEARQPTRPTEPRHRGPPTPCRSTTTSGRRSRPSALPRRRPGASRWRPWSDPLRALRRARPRLRPGDRLHGRRRGPSCRRRGFPTVRARAKVAGGRALIRYLLRHRHTTPFEMCELKLHIKAPIFVARQWLRHRTASVNEYSARYSRLDREFYVPDADHLQSVHEEQIGRQRASSSGMDDLFGSTEAVGERLALATQSDSNKQGRDDVLTDEEARQALSRLDWISTRAYGVYRTCSTKTTPGRPRTPTAPVSPASSRARRCRSTTTRSFTGRSTCTTSLHFLSLRADAHAQYEIRGLCRRDPRQDRHELGACDVPSLPRLWRWTPLRSSAGGLAVVKRMLAGEAVDQASSGLSKREWRELMAVLGARSLARNFWEL